MNYIYDIYLNLNKELFDFFEWNKKDKLTHIKKIPIFKISEKEIKNLINYKIKIDEIFLNKIFNKTETWNIKNKANFCTLFTDGNTVLAIEFNKNGISQKKSFLLVEEELDVLETIDKIKETTFHFSILNREKKLLKTRKELNIEHFIHKELKSIEEEKLNYIYFECFGKKEKNKKIILEELNKIQKNSKTYKNLYDILKLTTTTKK